MRRIVFVLGAVLCGLFLYSSWVASLGAPAATELQLPVGVQGLPPHRHHPQSSPCCQVRFLNYTPSPWERRWSENVVRWGRSKKAYCEQVRGEATLAVSALTRIGELMEGTSLGAPPGTSEAQRARDAEIFSRFYHEKRCLDGRTEVVESWIEPLVQALRNFNSLCGEHGALRREYLLLGSHLLQGEPSLATEECRPQVVYMDLGASLFDQGPGGPSQSFLFRLYAKRGLDIDRALMWEATEYNASDVLHGVPKKYLHAYQFLNIPAPHAPKDAGNPWNILRRIARARDFVTLKLDIDTPAVEMPLVEQLATAPDLAHLVDEFFFEHHTTFPVLALPGVWQQPGVTLSGTLADSYALFRNLRERGIRAHGWP